MARCHKIVQAGKRCIFPTEHEGDCTLGPIVQIDYRNWRGSRRVRKIVPMDGKMLYQASPPWHPKTQWLLGAIDVEDGQHKWWAMDGIFSWVEVQVEG